MLPLALGQFVAFLNNTTIVAKRIEKVLNGYYCSLASPPNFLIQDYYTRLMRQPEYKHRSSLAVKHGQAERQLLMRWASPTRLLTRKKSLTQKSQKLFLAIVLFRESAVKAACFYDFGVWSGLVFQPFTAAAKGQ